MTRKPRLTGSVLLGGLITVLLWSIFHRGGVELIDTSAGRLVRGFSDLPACNTWLNTQQCQGSDAFVNCFVLPGEINQCEGDCSGYWCDGNTLRSYCNSRYAIELNARNCITGPTTCGNQQAAVGTCDLAFDIDPNGFPINIRCECDEIVPTANPCPDSTVTDSEECDGGVIIGFYRPNLPKVHRRENLGVHTDHALAMAR